MTTDKSANVGITRVGKDNVCNAAVKVKLVVVGGGDRGADGY